MKKFIPIITVLLLFLTGCSLSEGKKETPPTLKVGVVLPLTGDFSQLGQETLKGIQLAQQKLQQSGKASIELIVEDDKSLNPVSATEAANKLTNIDHVSIVLTLIIEEARPIAPILSDNGIPLLVLWDSNQYLSESGPLVYSNGFSTERSGEIMAEYAHYVLGLKNIALVSHQDPWANLINKSFSEKFVDLGGTLSLQENIPISENDFRTTLTKVKQNNSDGIYFPLIPPGNIDFLKQVHEFNLNLPLMTGDTLLPTVISESGKNVEGVIYTNNWTDEIPELTELYQQTYGEKINDAILVSFGYDGLQKVIEAANPKNGNIIEGLNILFGEKKRADRIQKLYTVKNGIAEEIKF